MWVPHQIFLLFKLLRKCVRYKTFWEILLICLCTLRGFYEKKNSNLFKHNFDLMIKSALIIYSLVVYSVKKIRKSFCNIVNFAIFYIGKNIILLLNYFPRFHEIKFEREWYHEFYLQVCRMQSKVWGGLFLWNRWSHTYASNYEIGLKNVKIYVMAFLNFKNRFCENYKN